MKVTAVPRIDAAGQTLIENKLLIMNALEHELMDALRFSADTKSSFLGDC